MSRRKPADPDAALFTGLLVLAWELDVAEAHPLQESHPLASGQRMELAPDRIWAVSEGLVGRLDGQGRLRDAWWPEQTWVPRAAATVEALDDSELRSLPASLLPELMHTEPREENARRLLHRLRLLPELLWRRQRRERFWIQAGRGQRRKLFDLEGHHERRAHRPHLVDARLVCLRVPGAHLPDHAGRRGPRTGLVLAGRLKDLSVTDMDGAWEHSIVLLGEAHDGAFHVHRGWAGDLGALVHGRRRYGLPLVPGDFFVEKRTEGLYVLAAHGRPLLRAHHHSHGIARPPSPTLQALGLSTDAIRLRSRRRIPAGTVDGPVDRVVELRLPVIERKPTREGPRGIRLGFEGLYEAPLWDYEDLGDGRFGSWPDLVVGIKARLELPVAR